MQELDYLRSAIRDAGVQNDWFDEENDMWVIPSQTPGLKRTKTQTGEKYDHLRKNLTNKARVEMLG